MEVSSRFAAIARASNAVVMTKLHIDMEDRSGNLDLIIPYATLEPCVTSFPSSSWASGSVVIQSGKIT
nr:hypothetical protein [Acetobacter papayae]